MSIVLFGSDAPSDWKVSFPVIVIVSPLVYSSLSVSRVKMVGSGEGRGFTVIVLDSDSLGAPLLGGGGGAVIVAFSSP